jgi:hypothetical protein
VDLFEAFANQNREAEHSSCKYGRERSLRSSHLPP